MVADTTDTEEETPFDVLKRRVINSYEEEMDEDTPTYLSPYMDLQALNLSATYKLSNFQRIFDNALDEMDEQPVWESEEHVRQWEVGLAEEIVKNELREQFAINTSSMSLNIGIERRNADFLVTVMY